MFNFGVRGRGSEPPAGVGCCQAGKARSVKTAVENLTPRRPAPVPLMAQIEGSVAERTFVCQTVRLSSHDLTHGGCFACGPDPLWHVGRPDCADRPGRGTHDRPVPAKNETPSSPERSQEPCRKGVTSDFDELFRGVRDYLTHPPERPTQERFNASSNDTSTSAGTGPDALQRD